MVEAVVSKISREPTCGEKPVRLPPPIAIPGRHQHLYANATVHARVED